MKLIILFLFLFACGSQKKPAVTYGSIVNATDMKIGGLENLPIGAKVNFDGMEYTRINDSQFVAVEAQHVASQAGKTIDKSRTKIIVNSNNKEVDNSKNKPKETNRIKTEINENSKNKSTKKNGLPWWFFIGMIIAIAVYLFRKYLNIKPFG